MSSSSLWRFEAIGTQWEVETSSELGSGLRRRVRELIDGFDRQWSRFREDSLVSHLATTGGAVQAPPDACEMLDAFRELSEATGGAVNPLIGNSLSSRGYDAEYSLRDHGAHPAPSGWQQMLTWNMSEVSLYGTETIDVGALGKGRLVDLVLAALEAQVDGSILVDVSGDLAVRGGPARVGLEDPANPGRIIGVWDVTDAALCASAANRRVWGDDIHHVLDARTGQPVRDITATWVKAPDAMHADAVATALFFEGGSEIAARWGIEWVRLTDARQVEWSPGVTAELFL